MLVAKASKKTCSSGGAVHCVAPPELQENYIRTNPTNISLLTELKPRTCFLTSRVCGLPQLFHLSGEVTCSTTTNLFAKPRLSV